MIKLFTVLRQISIHALRRERDDRRALCRISRNISIHALRRERDLLGEEAHRYLYDFNPRAPQGARPPTSVRKCGQRYFNPRAPQGARRYDPYVMIYNKHFNPRAPQGARRVRAGTTGASILFQSTRSAGSATLTQRNLHIAPLISIHALRRERD